MPAPFDALTLTQKMAVVLSQSREPLTMDALVAAMHDRGVPLDVNSLHQGWRQAVPIRERDDGRLEVVRGGVEYAGFCRHLRHTVGYVFDPQPTPPVNTDLPSEWYSPSLSGALDAAVPGPEEPVTTAEFEEAARLANRHLPPNFVRTLSLVWLETAGGRGDIRLLVETLGQAFVHKDVEAVYLNLHTTRAATTDRDSGHISLNPTHPDHLSARHRFREWLRKLTGEDRKNQVDQARLRAFEQQAQATREQAMAAFLVRRQGVVLMRFDLGAPCGGIVDPITHRAEVFIPADAERLMQTLQGLQVAMGVGIQEVFERLHIPTEDRVFIDLRTPAQYVTVGRHRRKLHQDDAVTFTVGVAPESGDSLSEVWHKTPQQWPERVTRQLRILERWYSYGRQHGYVLTGSHASQTVPVDWNPGGLPTMAELIADAVESETVVEVSQRAHPAVYRPAAVIDGPPQTLWWLDTGHIETLDATRLAGMRRPAPLGDDGTEPFTMVVLRVRSDSVLGLRLRDQRRIELFLIQCGTGVVEGEVLDVTPTALEEHANGLRVEGRVLSRGWSVGHLNLPSMKLGNAGDSFELEARDVPQHTLSLQNAMEEAQAGNYGGATALLQRLLDTDLRCLDAHAHVGSLWFNHGGAHGADMARKRYELGTRIGQASLPSDFTGALLWARPGNRPLLRCLFGHGLSLWRLGQFSPATDVFTRLLALNPTDEQGVRFVLPLLAERVPWSPEGEEWA